MILKRGLYTRMASRRNGLAMDEGLAEFCATGHEDGDGMRYGSLDAFLTEGQAALAKGPVAIILAEDAVEVETTLRHHLAAGFAEVLLLAHPALPVAPEAGGRGPPHRPRRLCRERAGRLR